MNGRGRRILVALDSSAGARAAMEAAAELASRLEAEVLALFVEDVELLHLAGLPFAREIGADALERPLDLPRLERRLRTEARTAQGICTSIAERSRAAVRFEVVRGPVAREILAAAEQADMVVLGRGSREAPSRRLTPQRRPASLGRTTSSVLASSTRTVAVFTAEHVLGRPIAVLYDGTGSCRRALDLAIRLAGEDHRNLVVLVPTSPPEALRIGAEATEIAAEARITPRIVVVPETRALATAILATGCRAVVLDRHCTRVATGGGLVDLVTRLECPVFVVG